MMQLKAIHPQFELSNKRAEARTVVALIGAFWLASSVLSFSYQVVAVISERATAPKLAQAFVEWLAIPGQVPAILVGCGTCWILYLLAVRVSLLPLRKQIAVASLLVLGATTAFSAVVTFVLAAVGAEPEFLRATLMRTIRSLAPFGLWCGFMLALTHNRRVHEREARLAFYEARAREAEIAALRYQVNPHLLYNALNSIAALILDRQNDAAEAMVLKLSDFFRASLGQPHGSSSLGEEIALQRLYLEIEQMRFPNLSSSFEVESGLYDATVPSLILQPLIENVLKHGVRPDGSPTNVRVTAQSARGALTIIVADNGTGRSSRSGTGIGLANVRDRLFTLFGDDASLESQAVAGEGFRVIIKMPLIMRKRDFDRSSPVDSDAHGAASPPSNAPIDAAANVD